MADASGASGLPALSVEEQASAPALLAGHWKLYGKSGGVYVKSPAGTESGPLGTGTGSVTSVGLTVPAFLSVAGSPITTSGTLAVTLATQTANIVFAGPVSGAAAAPTFRSLVSDDIPSLAASKITSGTLALARGGTNADLSAAGPGHLVQTTAGGNVTTRLDKLNGTVAPTVNEDSGDGYSIGSRWYDLTNDKEYVLLDSTVAAAVWKETTAAAGSSGYATVEDEGSALTQRTNINFVGAGVTAADSGGKTVVTIPGGGGSGWVLLTNCSGTVGAGGVASVTLPSSGVLATGYYALKLVLSGRGEVAALNGGLYLRPNNDSTAANYRGETFVGQGVAEVSSENNGAEATIATGVLIPGSTALANHFGSVEITVTDHESTTRIKCSTGTYSFVQSTSTGNFIVGLVGGIWNSTAAITTLVLICASGDIAEGTTYRLYGLP